MNSENEPRLLVIDEQETEISFEEILKIIKSCGPHKKIQVLLIKKLGGNEENKIAETTSKLANELFMNEEVARKIEEAIYGVISELLKDKLLEIFQHNEKKRLLAKPLI